MDAVELLADLEFLRKENTRLREALRLLYDNQNGPPLYKYQKQWNEAMQLASEALGIKADYES